MTSVRIVALVDGPLAGQVRATGDGPLCAVDPGDGRIVTYYFRRFAFRSGGKCVSVWTGWCGPEPDAEAIMMALLRPELAAAAEVVPVG